MNAQEKLLLKQLGQRFQLASERTAAAIVWDAPAFKEQMEEQMEEDLNEKALQMANSGVSGICEKHDKHGDVSTDSTKMVN